jgi:hypothetical protein
MKARRRTAPNLTSSSRPARVTAEALTAAEWLTSLWRPWYPTDMAPPAEEIQASADPDWTALMRRKESEDREYAARLAQLRHQDMAELYREVMHYATAAMPPLELLKPLAHCPPAGWVHAKDHPLREGRPGMRHVRGVLREFTIELGKETLRHIGPVSAAADDFLRELRRAQQSARAVARIMRLKTTDDGRRWRSQDAYFDGPRWERALQTLRVLEFDVLRDILLLHHLRQAARVGPRSTPMRSTTRAQFFSVAGAGLIRNLLRAMRRHNTGPDVDSLRTHKVARLTAERILNLVYRHLLDRPLTADDLKSRAAYRRRSH